MYQMKSGIGGIETRSGAVVEGCAKMLSKAKQASKVPNLTYLFLKASEPEESTCGAS